MWWRRLGGSALVVALGVGSLSLYVAHGKANDPETGGYPQRIGFERPSDRLPDRPGPLAATLYDNDFGTGRDLGVAATGRLWELPSGTNALSPSGTLLLTQPGERPDRLAVHDLSTGRRWVLRGTRPGWPGGPTRVSWAQDESAVLADFAGVGRPGRRRAAVLDVTSGALTDVPGGEPAGFRSPAEPVTVREVGGPGTVGGIVATTTDLDTGATRELPLRLAGRWLGAPDAELVASIAPDGRTILLVEAGERSGAVRVRLFSLADGTELAPRSVSGWDGCSPSWRGQDPVLPTTSQPGGPGSARRAGAALLTEDGSTSLVAVHPRLQSACLQLAAHALTTGPRWALFGTWTAEWTWYWLPGLIVVALVLLGLVMVVTTARRTWATASRGHALRRHPWIGYGRATPPGSGAAPR
jgi:hypothetical protein